ncbi:MAG: NTP transferase domain-containing protein [Burkholderiaceae bacterium]|nr:NTP transferase domain-containing protein [Burkholderiaceae bacterium]
MNLDINTQTWLMRMNTSGHKTTPVAAVVLAAGAGKRMGGRPKALLQRDGQPLLARQIDLLTQAGAQAVVVALGHHAEAYVPVLQAARARLLESKGKGVSLRWVRNPDPDGGTASSLRCGLAALPADAAAVLVALADQPLLQADDVRAVLHMWNTREPDVDLVLPGYHGKPGHPVVFGPALRQAIEQQTVPGGVRAWRLAHPERVRTLAATHPRYTLDIDSNADLAALAAEHGVELRWPDSQDGAILPLS